MSLEDVYNQVDSTWMTDNGVAGFGPAALEPGGAGLMDGLSGVAGLAGTVLGGPLGGIAGSLLGGSSPMLGGSPGETSSATSSATLNSGSFQTGGNDWVTVAIIAAAAVLIAMTWKK